MKKLLIIGAGDGGIILSNSLSAKEFDITFIDPESVHYFQPELLHVALEGKKEKSISKLKLIPKKAKLLKKSVQSVDLDNRKVLAEGETFEYDYVVVNTGSKPDYTKIPGHKTLYDEFGDFHSNSDAAKKLYMRLSQFKGGKAVVGVSYPVFKCPPSPVEAVFLLEEFINKKGLKKNTEITFVTPFPRAYPSQPINDIIEPMLKERNVRISTFFDVEEIKTDSKKITSIEGDAIDYDFAAIVPPHRGSGVVKDNCDSDGFVNTDKFKLNIGKYDDAFCIGDATNILTAKSGVTAHLEAKVVAKRLEGIDERFDGRTNCPFETGYGKGTFVISNYEEPAVKLKPNRMNYMMKKTMAMMAWSSLKGSMDFVFDQYFKMTDPKKLNAKYGKL